MLRDVVEKAKRISTNYNDIEQAIRDAESVASRRVPGCRLVVLSEPRPLFVIGDIHGDWPTLHKIASRIDAAVAEKGLGPEDYYIVFLGDYIDRGEYQIETLLSVALAYTIMDNVVVLRGNHEPPKGLEPYPHDFPYLLLTRLGPTKARRLYNLCMEFFDKLPLAAKLPKILLMLHGGPPIEEVTEKADLHSLLRCPNGPPGDRVLEEILWNDPTEDADEWLPSPRGAGYLWGPMVTDAVLERENIKAIVRAHEPCFNGYKFNHGGRVLTLFSCILPHYGNQAAGYLQLEEPWRLREEKAEVLRRYVRLVEAG